MLKKTAEIICEFVMADPDSITENTNLRLDLGLSSFDLINIAVEIEDRFGAVISNSDLARMKTVGDIVSRAVAA